MRNDPVVTEKFRKDVEAENILTRMNDSLLALERSLYVETDRSVPILFILGVPRSGTTLLYQLISSCLDIGYVDNLIARFWRAPVCGIKLSQQVLPKRPLSSFRSQFGRTDGLHEPHEFGYFWHEKLKYEEMHERDKAFEESINWDDLRTTLLNMANAFGKSIVFKYFPIGWHIEKIRSILPKSRFVYIERDPVDNALSLLKLRRKFLGDINKWCSAKPKEYEWLQDEPPWRQVAGQVVFLQNSFNRNILNYGSDAVVKLKYDALCKNPEKSLEIIRAKLKEAGANVGWRYNPPSKFSVKSPEDPEGYRKNIIKSVEEFKKNISRRPVN